MSIVIEQRPGQPTNSGSNPYPNLRRNPDLLKQNQGGKFALPSEFDSNKWASAFYQEGNESSAMSQDQVLQGTDLIAEGWAVWRYPDDRFVKVPDEQTGEMKDDLEPHPLAGQPHKVHGLKPGEVYVLHCRPRAVQDDVNRVYGEVSREQMIREIQGDTLTTEEGMSPSGMLTNRLLEAEIGRDAEIEAVAKLGSAAVDKSAVKVRGKRSQTVSQ